MEEERISKTIYFCPATNVELNLNTLKKWEKQVIKLEDSYDKSLEDLTYDAKMEDIFSKHYIKNQYIFLDDTIKTMRQKITVSIPISSKFGKSIRLLPETQRFVYMLLMN